MSHNDEEIGLIPVFTLVLWITCLTIALIGFLTDESTRPAATQPAQPPVELLTVDLAAPDQSPRDSGLPQKAEIPEARVSAAPPPAAPVLPPGDFPVFQPLIAPRSFVAPLRLTFGRGAGRQPAPEYPREAALTGEEGTVVARFEVGEDGRVDDAQTIVPCPWPLLNQSVLRTIRHDWRFSPGPPRRYEIAIEFHINRQ